jgi:hypothetical protein
METPDTAVRSDFGTSIGAWARKAFARVNHEAVYRFTQRALALSIFAMLSSMIFPMLTTAERATDSTSLARLQQETKRNSDEIAGIKARLSDFERLEKKVDGILEAVKLLADAGKQVLQWIVLGLLGWFGKQALKALGIQLPKRGDP